MSDVWDVSAPAAQPFFRLQRRWRPLAGFGFGLREPAITGQILVSLPEALDFAALDSRMARYIKEKPPEEKPGDSDALRLVRRAMFWAGALQRQANLPVFGDAYINGPHRSDGGAEAFRLAVPYYAPQAAATALQWVSTSIDGFLTTGRLRPVAGEEARREFAALGESLGKFRPNGINTYRFLRAAHTLNIPATQFMPGVFSFGTGARARWLQSSFTDRTSLLASRFAGNKFLAAQVLRRAGLPAPVHERARSAEEAVTIAQRLGYPVVVKPSDRQQGRGVAANLQGDQAVVAAYRNAAKISQNILVEKHFDGDEFRITVLDGKVFRVAVRLPGGVAGDGKNTIAQLVELQQRSELAQRRARERGHVLLVLDEEAQQLLSEARLSPESVLPAGQFQRLRRRANVSAGGSLTNLAMDQVHPDNIRLAERAVAALRLDIGGVDLIIADIKKSWMETGALICEVNAQPQIGFQSTQPLIEQLFSGGARIPIVLVIGSAADIDWGAVQAALPAGRIGHSSDAGVWLGTERIAPAQATGFAAGQILLNNPQTEGALILMKPEEVRRLGLPFDSCDALILAGPDRWDAREGEHIADVVELAGPHAGLTIHTQPSNSLPAGILRAYEMRASVEPTLGEACVALLRSALEPKQRLAG